MNADVVVIGACRVSSPPANWPTRATASSCWTRSTLRADGSVLDGLWAVGEAAGFGGGGAHGRRALDGTFLGGCLHTRRVTGRALAAR